jgi:hypothetical protein
MIIYGVRATKIGALKIDNTPCEYCENTGTQHVVQYGRYFHVFWIPMFPVGRKTFSECVHCKRTQEKKMFSQKLKNALEFKKGELKRPIWHFSGLILICLVILYVNVIKLFAS